MMLQQSAPTDYVIATGRMETVRRFCELAAIELGWGSGNNKGLNGRVVMSKKLAEELIMEK